MYFLTSKSLAASLIATCLLRPLAFYDRFGLAKGVLSVVVKFRFYSTTISIEYEIAIVFTYCQDLTRNFQGALIDVMYILYSGNSPCILNWKPYYIKKTNFNDNKKTQFSDFAEVEVAFITYPIIVIKLFI